MCGSIHLCQIVGLEIKLVHMCPALHWLRFIKQSQVYMQLYTSGENAYLCLCAYVHTVLCIWPLIQLPTHCSSVRQEHDLCCIVYATYMCKPTQWAMHTPEGQFAWWARFSSTVRPLKLIILIVPSVDVKFNKSGRDHSELIVNTCHCLAVYIHDSSRRVDVLY